MIVALIGIVGIYGLVPWSDQTLIVERSYFIHTAQSLIRLSTARIIMTVQEPKELSADTVTGTLSQLHLFHQNI